MLNTPVLFLIFNRPENTIQVFKKISEAKPAILYIAADGPRNELEKIKCEETRAIVNKIDWDCDVKVLFREQNLGCKKAISEAINWFFDQVEEGIILEDDCVPDVTFFWFCEKLLERYRDNENVFHISGNNFQYGRRWTKTSYYYSYIAHVWGWATWKRAWTKYKASEDWLFNHPNFSNELNNINRKHVNYFFNMYQSAKGSSWAIIWMLSLWIFNGLAILPNSNMVTNIGFGNDSTHTSNFDDILANIPTHPICEIIYNDKVVRNKKADNFTFNKVLIRRTLWRIVITKIKRFIYG